MKYALCLLLAACICCSCQEGNKKGNCSGFVVKETVHNADHDQLSVKYTLYCDGECPDGVSCKKEKVYNPPQPNGLVKIEWCGCSNEPDACTIVLKTYNMNGRTIQQADCTAWTTCPDGDSCVQNPSRSKTETVLNADNTAREYHYTDTLTCDCIARK